jgi:hypothetical protein
MTHGYSLRSNAKGRRGHKSTDETDDDQVEGTSISTSTGSSSTRERRRKTLTDELEGDSGIVDPPNPDTPNSPAPPQDSKRRPTPTSFVIRVADCGRPEVTWEDIQAVRRREEARGFAEAVRIRREQIVRGYEAELRDLRARIVVLRKECEAEVERTRRRRELKWAFERGEVAVVVESRSSSPFVVAGSDLDSGGVLEAAQSMNWTRRRPEDRVPSIKDNASKEAGRGAERLATPNAQGLYRHSLPGPSWALANAHGKQFPRAKERAEEGLSQLETTERLPTLNDHPSQGHHHPQPLRRQPAQLLMVVDT